MSRYSGHGYYAGAGIDASAGLGASMTSESCRLRTFETLARRMTRDGTLARLAAYSRCNDSAADVFVRAVSILALRGFYCRGGFVSYAMTDDDEELSTRTRTRTTATIEGGDDGDGRPALAEEYYFALIAKCAFCDRRYEAAELVRAVAASNDQATTLLRSSHEPTCDRHSLRNTVCRIVKYLPLLNGIVRVIESTEAVEQRRRRIYRRNHRDSRHSIDDEDEDDTIEFGVEVTEDGDMEAASISSSENADRNESELENNDGGSSSSTVNNSHPLVASGSRVRRNRRVVPVNAVSASDSASATSADGVECGVCTAKCSREYAVIPCGHVYACLSCHEKDLSLRANNEMRCFVCRKRVWFLTAIYRTMR